MAKFAGSRGIFTCVPHCHLSVWGLRQSHVSRWFFFSIRWVVVPVRRPGLLGVPDPGGSRWKAQFLTKQMEIEPWHDLSQIEFCLMSWRLKTKGPNSNEKLRSMEFYSSTIALAWNTWMFRGALQSMRSLPKHQMAEWEDQAVANKAVANLYGENPRARWQ